MADDGWNLDPDVQAAEGYGSLRRSAQILRLGVQERRQDGRGARLHPHAGQGRRRSPEDVVRRHQGLFRQAYLRHELKTGMQEDRTAFGRSYPRLSGMSPPQLSEGLLR